MACAPVFASTLAIPRSPKTTLRTSVLAVLPLRLLAKNMLAGLISRWIMRALCKYCNALANCRNLRVPQRKVRVMGMTFNINVNAITLFLMGRAHNEARGPKSRWMCAKCWKLGFRMFGQVRSVPNRFVERVRIVFLVPWNRLTCKADKQHKSHERETNHTKA